MVNVCGMAGGREGKRESGHAAGQARVDGFDNATPGVTLTLTAIPTTPGQKVRDREIFLRTSRRSIDEVEFKRLFVLQTVFAFFVSYTISE